MLRRRRRLTAEQEARVDLLLGVLTLYLATYFILKPPGRWRRWASLL